MPVNDRIQRLAKPFAPLAVLLALYYLMAVTGVLHKSMTFDEVAHVTAGYSYNALGDFRLQPENGNLPQRWVALPSVWSHATFPRLDQPSWTASDVWVIGDQFFHDVGNDADTLLWRARAMTALLGVICGAVVFGWSRRLYPGAGPWVSLALFVFCPTMLAHGALATSDMAAALFFTATTGALWVVLHRVTPWTILLSTCVMGGLFIAKFSAPLIVPIGLLMVAVRLASSRPVVLGWRERTREVRGRLGRLSIFVGLAVVHMLVAWVIIWAAYGFRDNPFVAGTTGMDHFDVDAARLHAIPVPMQHYIDLASEKRLLPKAYLYGFNHTLWFAQGRWAFLNGEYSNTGWRSFFPYAFAVKTTLPMFGVLLLALAAFFAPPNGTPRRLFDGIYATTPLWALLVIYWGFAITSKLNIGHRHLLPIYPALMILAGGAGCWIDRLLAARRAARAGGTTPLIATRSPIILGGLLTLLLAWHAGVSLFIRPHYLAYFNELVGPSNGYRHLVDSSLDWGQDLPGLKTWLDERGLSGPNKTDPVYLSYFGAGRPGYYQIDATLLPCFLDRRPRQIPQGLTGGYYCISASILQGVFVMGPGHWKPQYEETYQLLRAAMEAFDRTADNPAARDALMQRNDGAEHWEQIFNLWEKWRLARLTAYLRRRDPSAQVGYSILIYKLTDQDVRDALLGPPPYPQRP